MGEQKRKGRKLILAKPHGFCAGVARAVEIAKAALDTYPPPVYCLNEIVHNGIVVGALREQGMVFVKGLEEVPRGSVLLFSAHGVAPAVWDLARERGLKVIDATCPFVLKVHTKVKRFAAEAHTVLLIGHRGHEEIVGVAGEAPQSVIVVEGTQEARAVRVPDPERVAIITQTTLCVEETRQVVDILRSRFPRLRVPAKSDICYATENRQRAVRALTEVAELVLVLGATNSSNSKRLVEVAGKSGCRAALVSGLDEVDKAVPKDIHTLGVTAGASAPASLVRDVIDRLRQQGFERVETLEVMKEDVSFPLPPELRK